MPTEKKEKVIKDLEKNFSKTKVGVLTDYRGLTTTDVTALRRKLRAAGVDYKVVKNTLARIAAKNAGKPALGSGFVGPMAIAFGYGELSEPAKIITEHIAATRLNMNIKGGFLGDRLITAKEVVTLATLPSREVLISRALAGIQLPLYALLGQLNAPLRGLMTVLQGRVKQLES